MIVNIATEEVAEMVVCKVEEVEVIAEEAGDGRGHGRGSRRGWKW